MNKIEIQINWLLLAIVYFTVSSPEVVIYPESEKVMVMAGDIKKSFKLDNAVNYLDGE